MRYARYTKKWNWKTADVLFAKYVILVYKPNFMETDIQPAYKPTYKPREEVKNIAPQAKKGLLCRIGLHNWEMQTEFMLWKCAKCGETKKEHLLNFPYL